MLRGLIAGLPNLILGLVLLAVTVYAAGGVRRLVQRIAKRAGQAPGAVLIISRLASWGVIFLGALVALTVIVPELTAATLVSSIGLTGVAIGFAFKDIFQNLLAGILILLTRPFQIGDQIVSGPHEGTVEDIQVRATLLRTYDNRLVVIPNSELYTTRVIVNTAFDMRRIDLPIGIGYGDDIPAAKRLILETVAQLPDIRPEPTPTVLVRGFGDFAVNLELRFWIDPPYRKDVLESHDSVYQALKAALLDHGIDLPLPTYQVLFHNQTEPSDGDRRRQREGWPAQPGDQ